ncbi:NAD(P)-binding domain-containing protein [Paenibacillus sp. MMO-177]|uniref:NAD(P)-binding domain-containing protein n=1 Tax=Paenibacillus sp. MMO-177 TaxID=3081289 RepID=UPI0030190099
MELAHKYKIAIIGLGYVGLPLAKLFVEKGNTVYGIDTDIRKIQMLQKRQSYLSDYKRNDIRELFSGKKFHVSHSFEVIEKADVIILCVPTPLDEQMQPDLKFVINATRCILPHLKRGQLIALESSTFPGTSEEILKPLLEREYRTGGRDGSSASLFAGTDRSRVALGAVANSEGRRRGESGKHFVRKRSLWYRI